MLKKIFTIGFFVLYIFNENELYCNQKKDAVTLPEIQYPEKPPIDEDLKPIIPDLPKDDDIDIDGNLRKLEKNYTMMIESKVNIFVPLEITSDIDINATVFGNQIIDVPFQIELNREPEKKDYYKLKYSEKELDMDGNGQIDTVIHSPEYVNTRYIKDNFVRIDGGKISNEGEYKKTVYITVEAGI